MRNKYPGKCYKCGNTVNVGEGHFERYQGAWRLQCVGHASKVSPIIKPKKDVTK